MDYLIRRQHICGTLCSGLDMFKCPVVIDWGFPPEHLDTVRKLFDGGVVLWWFAADWAVARRKFQLRRYPHVQDFDIQIQKIKDALPQINAVFEPHIGFCGISGFGDGIGSVLPPQLQWAHGHIIRTKRFCSNLLDVWTFR